MAEVDKALDPVAVRLGGGLRGARLAAGVSQAELARRLGVAPNQLNRWEAGGRRLDLETIEQAEQRLGLPRGTVFRLAGYVEDAGLLDVATLPAWASKAVRAILRDLSVDGDGADGPDGAS